MSGFSRRLLSAAFLATLLPAAEPFRPAPRLTLVQRAHARTEDIASGKFLVADKDLPDPNFAETVVLLVQYNDQGAMGLMINRRSKVPLSRLFPAAKDGKNGSDPIYAGGPVETAAGFGVLRSRTKPEEAQSVFGDVYLISTKVALEKTVAAGKESSVFRLYLGYCGWGAGQLEHEVELGAWHILPASSALVFDADPDSVWSRLIQKTELRIALAHWPERP